MKMQELNHTELQEVNGGALLGGLLGGDNSTSSSQGGILGSLGIGNLLSYQSASKNGDQATATSFSLGNDITSSLGGIFGNSQKSA
jgi:bacteriocin-like protein